jgi:hypothetical protein
VKFNVYVLLVGACHVSYIATALGIQVWGPDDQVVDTKDRLLEEETFVIRFHFNVLREDIIDSQIAPREFHLRLKVHLPRISRLPHHYIRTYGWMMRYLFSYKFILPRLLKLKCLPKQRIERLLRKLLNVCMLHSQVQTYIGQSFNGVFFFCGLI